MALLPPELIRILISSVLIVSFVFLNAMILVYIERKVAGHIQRRPGPMEVGPHGILQTLIDGLKLMGKQIIFPDNIDKPLFCIAPLLAFVPAVVAFVVIPFSPRLQAVDLDMGIIFILALASLNVLAILLAGWSSNNKYSLIGAMRSVAQNIAYEIPMLLSLLAVLFMTNSLSMKSIVEAQKPLWFIVVQPVAFLIYFIASLAETNRAPFDLPEAESELTAGFHTEYGGMAYGLFYLGEYANMVMVGAITTTFFLGGWSGPPLPYMEYSGAFWFLAKVYFIVFSMIWFRWTFPRVRFDQLMNFCWKIMVPFGLVNLMITALVLKI